MQERDFNEWPPLLVTGSQIPGSWSNVQAQILNAIFAYDVTNGTLLPSSFGENDSLVDTAQQNAPSQEAEV